MNNITIGRLADSDAQGVIRPADGSWQLVIDKDGYPHLYIRVKLEDENPEEPKDGLLCLEDMLPPGTTIPDLMKGSFGGKLSPEEEKAAFEEFQNTERTIPCPRP